MAHCSSLPLILLVSLLPASLQILISQIVSLWVSASTHSQSYYAHALLLLTFGLLIAALIRNIVITNYALRASHTLHRAMLSSLLHTSLSFLDSQPLGKLLTRFSKDIAVMDSVLPPLLTYFLQAWCRVFSVLIVVCLINPWLLLSAAFVFILAFLIRNRLLSVQSQVMSLELQSRAPITTHISACLADLPSLRCYSHSLPYLSSQFQSLIDANGSALFTYYSLVCTLAPLLDFLMWGLISFVAFFSLFLRSNPTHTILSLQLMLDLIDTFQQGTILSSEVVSYFASVSRCLEYTSLPPQDPSPSSPISPPSFSLQYPSLQFRNVSMRYSSNSEYALSNLSFKIPPGSKVGVVGRTGAGKSSLLQALLRLTPIQPEGSILIGSRDITEISVSSLRSSITFIPQKPFLLNGSVRQQLNPTGEELDDEVLWSALKAVHLDSLIRSLPEQLSTFISNDCTMLSLGQKQLLCLGRALLQNKKIVLLDEPTANVDFETERIISQTIQSHFQASTVLTIAHRLDSIIHCDLLLVLDRGTLLEKGPPLKLMLANENDTSVTGSSLFAQMVRDTQQPEILLKKAQAA